MTRPEWALTAVVGVLTVVVTVATGLLFLASSRIDGIYSQQAQFAADIAATKTAVEFIRADVAEMKEIIRRVDTNTQRAALGVVPPTSVANLRYEKVGSLADVYTLLQAKPVGEGLLGALKGPEGEWTAVYGGQDAYPWLSFMEAWSKSRALGGDTSDASQQPEK